MSNPSNVRPNVCQNVQCKPFSPDRLSPDRHDITAVVDLLIESAPELFELLFGRQSPEILSQLVVRSHNRFSYRHIRVAVVDSEVVGAATLIPAAGLRDQKDEVEVFSRWMMWRVKWIRRLILSRLLRYGYPDYTAYIGNLAVRSRDRNQGVGTQLLRACIEEARQAQCTHLFISVDVENPRAQKLYESLGFKISSLHRLSLLGRQFGSRVLELPLRSPNP